MGEKGSKFSSSAEERAEEVLERINSLEGISHKKMFGGVGIFYEKGMFALISPKGEFFIKADEGMQEKMASLGSVKHVKMPYYSIPRQAKLSNQEYLDLIKRSISLLK